MIALSEGDRRNWIFTESRNEGAFGIESVRGSGEVLAAGVRRRRRTVFKDADAEVRQRRKERTGPPAGQTVLYQPLDPICQIESS
jgi:hypothetical protein